MRRRDFIAALGSAPAWPIAARAQQSPKRMRRIAVLMGVADDSPGRARVAMLKQGLQELGWTEGRNIEIETRFTGAATDRIRVHVAELVALAPDVIVANTTPVIRALRHATSSIPIVMAAANDPQGFVSSLARPGGNITGLTFIDFPMIGKWLEMQPATPGRPQNPGGAFFICPFPIPLDRMIAAGQKTRRRQPLPCENRGESISRDRGRGIGRSEEIPWVRKKGGRNGVRRSVPRGA